jgi:diguanylate cyclase (GGDEF)-like protein
MPQPAPGPLEQLTQTVHDAISRSVDTTIMGEKMARVLVIDPNGRESAEFGDWLTKWGYEHEIATTASDTFSALARPGAAGIVIVDMPSVSVDAPQISARLGRIQLERPLQVLVVLDEQPPEFVRKALSAVPGGLNPDDFLIKPLEPRIVHGKLRNAERILQVQEELAQAAQALRFFASHDSLTSLTQRQAAMEMLRHETQRSVRTHAPVSLLLVDLDVFGKLNMDVGFDAGDAVLREVGMRLRRCMRGYDYASRYGNDEFLVLLPECSLKDAEKQAERLQVDVFGPAFQSEIKAIKLSACIAVTESYGRHANVVLGELEKTLNYAKMAGKNSVVCAHNPDNGQKVDHTLLGRPKQEPEMPETPASLQLQ